jgi:hypothetical protein
MFLGDGSGVIDAQLFLRKKNAVANKTKAAFLRK